MKLIPYINFNGNCAKAIAFYEKVFNVKAEFCTWGDMQKFDPKAEVPSDKEKWIMHSCLKIGRGLELQLADCDQHGASVGTNICLQLSYKTQEEVREVYTALRNGGKVICKLGKAFFAPLYGEFLDKFGIRWSIMQSE